MVDVNLGNVRGLQGLPGATGNGIRSIEKTGTSGKVDTYTITYDDGVPLEVNHMLDKNTTETYKVRLAFRTDIDPSDLPTSGATHTLSFGLSYIQADDNSISVPHPIDFSTDSWETIVAAVQLGFTDNYSVGDTKSITLGNSLGTHTLRIANKSTPSKCYTAGFSQTACGFVLEFVDFLNCVSI